MNKGILSRLYRHNLTLLTDLYQLTMANGYWENDLYDNEAVFHMFFRKTPFNGNYAIACGLELLVDFIKNFRFEVDDIQYLAGLKAADGTALFDESFLNYLQRLEFTCDVDALPEGTLCSEHQPLLRIKGPLLQAQLLETVILNIINFSTLIATKAARIIQVANGDSVLEFGLRRAQGIDGGLTASRAAYIGGCHATSNVLAGKLFKIPVRGTHAHSWVMSFDYELEAFASYAESMSHNSVFLVDTYDTIEGVKHAIQIGYDLRDHGQEMLGIRLDSGDLAELSIAARKLLDEAGFPNAKIVASNDLDEHSIKTLKEKGAQITVWGIGTKLSTAYDQPALGGVYKLAAIKDQFDNWQDRIKLSEQSIKTSNPGIQQIVRLFQNKIPVADVIYDTKDFSANKNFISFVKFGKTHPSRIKFDESQELLVPIFRKGKLVYKLPDIKQIRARTISQLKTFEKVDLNKYPKGLESRLWKLKSELIENHNKQTVKI
ncbi:MAG TPA: nicotinate phosphoribosyltransferase [Saprospiraceae bacterium]|nr:nicotinate phosphoribosyltransferase [Saprospiraceae bacterium]